MSNTAQHFNIPAETKSALDAIGTPSADYTLGDMKIFSPISGELIGQTAETSPEETHRIIEAAHKAFLEWRSVPAPKRGELVRLFGEELRRNKAALGRVISIEAGKIVSEGLGEVQEMIDICDFAVGLSRQLYGLTIATEREDHRMMESWQPLGVVGVISAFNFPAAVWAWNAAIALVCGDSLVWKPSEKTPLTAIASHTIFKTALARYQNEGYAAPEGLSGLIMGRREAGEALCDDPLVRLVSATGSCAMGRAVGPRVAKRFGRSLLELGGNNAAIVCPSADLDLALRGVAFAAMGTAGQRCTTLRRLFVHDTVYDSFVAKLKAAYQSVKVGNPMHPETLVGPLIDKASFDSMQAVLAEAKAAGTTITGGERIAADDGKGGFYARPALVEIESQNALVKQETFAPILYVMRYTDLTHAIALQNDVDQGLSSSIFTTDIREAELFVSARGSDCGIANVNIGPSGAEIGGAFGGEKETGGGRESGSDAWKAYMRRQTNTINYGHSLPLAQGVKFDV